MSIFYHQRLMTDLQSLQTSNHFGKLIYRMRSSCSLGSSELLRTLKAIDLEASCFHNNFCIGGRFRRLHFSILEYSCIGKKLQVLVFHTGNNSIQDGY
jgi:hypothetical protein